MKSRTYSIKVQTQHRPKEILINNEKADQKQKDNMTFENNILFLRLSPKNRETTIILKK